MMSFLLVNLIFAAIALAVGFVAGAWCLGSRTDVASEGAAGEKSTQEFQRQLNVERTAMATDRLRDLATGMASDVGEHSLKVEEVTNKLKALDLNDIEATGAGLVSALTQIVEANEDLQKQLIKAEAQVVAQAQEIRTHETEARTDSLTNLANRRAFDDELRRRFSEWQRKGAPVSLLILDIDFFKKFNDIHGHQAGDEVLRRVGAKLAETCRDMDLPCRYGGEEFAVVMPATVAKDGKIAAERLRTAVESMVVNFEGKTLKVTTSAGLAQVNNEDDIVRVLKRADEALYQSKAAGRNCGHLHDGQYCVPFTPGKMKTKTEVPAAAEPVATELLDKLPNRTKFAEELRRRVAESHRTNQPLTVLLMEVTGYDELKREFGSAVGCLTLDSVALYLKKSLREMDLIARFGDNQFAVMLPASKAIDGADAGERAMLALNNCALPVGDGQVDLTMKYGVAEIETDDTVETLVGRAEKQLAGRQQPQLVAN